ncbi:polyisoprenoid-binding protein YceI [Pedobacter cryoconitis]|uniref:Polyisoprenoid-binding protein YceI n=1 Tax=Pedobacter cryoconitis TaxID=188932 RepID=A0A7W9DZX3_9SPHI|nr:YceI family protein [Pedobacter cryoconitis]MBB5637448.1 polyisoprenoid-binding protein YceI [Pedobacter cryoconitis]
MKQINAIVAIGTVLALSSFSIIDRLTPVTLNNPIEKHIKAVPYKVDAAQSKLTWLAKKVTGEHSGTIAVSSGLLNVENNVLKGGSFDLDTKSIAVTDITDKESNAKLLGHLKSEDFFAVDKFDKAKFVITSASIKGAGLYQIKGNLTIKGITNEVTFPASVKIDNTRLTANAKIVVDRTKYGIKFRSKSFFENLGDKTIADEFELNIQLAATK